ncbi:MAG TPA: hypothetical protein VFS44_08155 [Gemmatimonadaceae bacterium]|nr:hypothetical protein [Gemmatimonadaceae bacterium]
MDRPHERAALPIAAMLVAALCAPRPALATPARASRAEAGLAGLPASRVVLPRALATALAERRIPSFSRQTGLACRACHYQFLQLTPFGRMFKLGGYTLSSVPTIDARDTTARRQTLKLLSIPPLSAMLQASYTHVRSATPGAQNDATALPQQLSLFLGGALTPKIGTFLQFTYSGADGSFGMDNADIRFAARSTMASRTLLYGVTVNNSPSVEDPWNTTPAWGFPFAASDAAPSPVASTLIDGGLAQQVLGVGAYALWNDLVYAHVAAYRAAPQGTAQPLDSTAQGANRGAIPYWRVALERGFGAEYVMVGTYGLSARLYPQGVSGPTNRFTDVAVDAQYEHRFGGGGAIIGRTTWIHERQTLDAFQAADPPAAESGRHTLETFRVNASWVPTTRYGLGAGYFSTTGTADTLLYAPAPVSGSRTGKPDSHGVLGELDFNPWQNARLAFQYVHYGKFDGASSSYDGFGRRASDNDTAYLLLWLVF